MKVLNWYHIGKPVLKIADGTQVYIGRGSKWGNPFVIGQHGTREEVIEKYEDYLLSTRTDLLVDLEELCGKDLVCYCAPKACHGDILIALLEVFDAGNSRSG